MQESNGHLKINETMAAIESELEASGHAECNDRDCPACNLKLGFARSPIAIRVATNIATTIANANSGEELVSVILCAFVIGYDVGYRIARAEELERVTK